MAEFAAAASRLAGLAGALFGWRPGEFWDSTPVELGSVVAALSGEAGLVDADDLERLRRMLGEDPSTTGFASGPPPEAKLGEDQDG